MSFPEWCLLVLLGWLVWRLAGPSVRLLWSHRRLLARASCMRVLHPRLWAESRAEVRAESGTGR